MLFTHCRIISVFELAFLQCKILLFSFFIPLQKAWILTQVTVILCLQGVDSRRTPICLSMMPSLYTTIQMWRTCIKVGLGIISRTNADSQWNPVHNAFHRFFCCGCTVETKRFVSSSVNMILTWPPCCQRSSRATEIKRRVLENGFSERICYMFLISKCRWDWDQGLCTTSGLAFGEPQRNGKIRKKKVFRCRENRILPLRCGSKKASKIVVHRPKSHSPLHFDIRNI